MSLRTRLCRLEQTIRVDRGCPACRLRRGRIVAVESEELPDGTKARLGDRPMPCTLCGELPEKIVEVVHLLPLEPPEEGAGDDRGWRSRRTRASGRQYPRGTPPGWPRFAEVGPRCVRRGRGGQVANDPQIVATILAG
jgi:hypothetical protein